MDLVGRSLGQYRIEARLGKGGMGAVYTAYQPSLDRFVAIKVLPTQYSPDSDAARRFVREARAVAQLDHPNILPIMDFGQEGEVRYIVMKLVTGGTLKDRLGQPIALSETAYIVGQIAAALDHAHERGILHRDVKPSNVLLDEGNWVQLADFGLAKLMVPDQQLTATGAGVGTPAYMSPEQARGLDVHRGTDIYSLGVVLYEMVVGRLPFDGQTGMDMLLKHISEPAPPPCQVNPSVPPAMEGVILKALEKRPEDRYASAGEMARGLAMALGAGADMAFPAAGIPQDQATPALDLGSFAPPPTLAVLAPEPEVTPPPEPTRPSQIVTFVGREKELARYAGELATSHLAVITGMAGVGKTTLAAVLAQQAAPLENIFWHSFHQGEGADVIVWRLAGFLYWLGEDGLWHMLQGAQETGSRPPPLEVLFDYALELMRGRGYLLCLDDLQYVNDDPLLEQLFERLNEAVKVGELSLIVTSRRVPDFIASPEPLPGLDAAATDALLAARDVSLPEGLSSSLHTHTEGNAQLLTLAIEVLRQSRHPERVIANLAETEDIERYLIKEVDDGLDEQERNVMSAVAVLLGYPGTRDAIETVLDAGSVRRTLSDLCSRHLLTVARGEWGREYSQHAALRAFYYSLPGRRERREMHARAGEYYEDEEPGALKAALHYERAGETERAAELATSDVWASINRGQARPLSRLLAQFNTQQLAPALQPAVHIARGQVYALLDESDQARASYEAAMEELETQPDASAVRVSKARACRGMGDLLEHRAPQEALTWLRRGLDVLAGDSNLEEAALRIRIGSVQIALGELDDAQRITEQGLNLLSPRPSQLRARALINLGIIASFQGDAERLQDCMHLGFEISRQLHDDFLISEALNNLGMIAYMSGNWDEAIDDWQEALALAEKLGSARQRARLHLNLGFTYTRQGKFAEAREHLEKSLALAREHDLGEHRLNAQSNLAGLSLCEGDADAAAAALADAEALAVEMEMRPYLAEVYRIRASLYLAQGDLAAAHEAIDQSLQVAREFEIRSEEGASLRVLGEVLLAEGDAAPAVAALEESLAMLDAQDPYEAARARVCLGRYLAGCGDVERATSLLQEARATFAQLGAQQDLDETLRTLAKLHPGL
jgi:ATP/maltotriose-dependent transcriptional regulator MalT